MKQLASIYWPVRVRVAPSSVGKRIVIRSVKIVRYTGLSAAARRLARRMEEKGVEVSV